MANANNGTRKNNNNGKSVKTSATAKKTRTAAQLRANQLQKEEGKKVQAWLESHGLKKGVVYGAKYKAGKKAGKSDEQILEEIRAMQGANLAARAEKAATKTAKKANNVKSTASGVSRRNISSQRQKNLAKKFANAGLKWVGPSQTAFKQIKMTVNNSGNPPNDDTVIARIKTEHPEFSKNAPPIPRTKRTVAAAASNAVSVSVAANAGIPKGSYVCEKCRLVANAPAANSLTPANNVENIA
jgi:hypothetical protein